MVNSSMAMFFRRSNASGVGQNVEKRDFQRQIGRFLFVVSVLTDIKQSGSYRLKVYLITHPPIPLMFG